jgi:integrase
MDEFIQYGRLGILLPSPEKIWTFREVAEEYVRVKGELTSDRKSCLEDCIRYFSDTPIASIKPRHLDAFCDKLKEQSAIRSYATKNGRIVKDLGRKLSAGSINKRITLIRNIFKYATREGYTESFTAFDLHRLPPGKRSIALNFEQFEALHDELSATSPQVALFSLIGYWTGMRKSEVLGLEWNRIHLNGSIPYIELRAEHTKTKKPRVIPLVPVLVEALSSIKVRRIDGKLFSIQNLNSVFRAGAKRAGLEYLAKDDGRANIVPHDLRHSFLTNAFATGIPEHIRKALAGHKTASVHEDYIKLYIEQLYDAILNIYNHTTAPPKPQEARQFDYP